MANSPIYMPLYIGDYLSDTTHLSTVEHGAYLLLTFAYWKRCGPLPDDAISLCNIARVTFDEWQRTLDARLRPFFLVHDGFWHHKRIDEELKKASHLIEQKRRAGQASANARSNTRSTHGPTESQRRGNQSESESGVNKARAPLGGAGGDVPTLVPTLVELWPGELAAAGDKRVEALARSFSEIGATPTGLRAAKAKADKAWTSPGGPEALLKHYASFCPPVAAPPKPSKPMTDDAVAAFYEADRRTKEANAKKNGFTLAPAGTVHADELLAPKKKRPK